MKARRACYECGYMAGRQWSTESCAKARPGGDGSMLLDAEAWEAVKAGQRTLQQLDDSCIDGVTIDDKILNDFARVVESADD